MELGEPPVLPHLILPAAPDLPRPALEVPRADLPFYKPLVVPPSDLRPPPGVKGESKEEKPKEVLTPKIQIKTPPQNPDINYIEIPGAEDVTIPLPSNEILATAGTTAVVSVAATLSTTSLFKWLVSIMKPAIKQLWTRIIKKGSSLDSSSSSGQQDY